MRRSRMHMCFATQIVATCNDIRAQMLPPVIMGLLEKGRDAARNAALTHLALTHESTKLAGYADVSAPPMHCLN